MPKTLAEVAIDAGLVNKASAAKAGRMAEERSLPLVVVLVRDLRVDELALVSALRKQTRVPLVDPKDVQIDPEALRLVPREACARLRVLPMAISSEGATRVLRLAMADPTDTTAVAEVESVSQCEVDVSALPLSAIEELVEKGYKGITTAVTKRPILKSKGTKSPVELHPESEVSVTAQIPLSMLQAPPEDPELRLTALIQVLVGKGVLTEAELADALKKLK